MQAITSKYLGPTNTKGSRIKAECTAGSITMGYYAVIDETGTGDEERNHEFVVAALKAKLAKDKKLQHWDRPTVCGQVFRTGEYVHVYTPSAQPSWTAEDSAQARAEGWDVFHVDGSYHDVQKLDEAEKFGEDAHAVAHVYYMATSGSALHRKALGFVMREGNSCPAPTTGVR